MLCLSRSATLLVVIHIIFIAIALAGILLGLRSGKAKGQAGSAPQTLQLPTTPPTTHRSEGPSRAPLEVSRIWNSSAYPEFSEELQEIMPFLVPISGLNALLDPQSPQSKAAQFLVTEDRLVSTNDTMKLAQRYSLVVLYYALGGDSWSETDKWLTAADECHWSFITCSSTDGLMRSFAFIDIPGPGLVGSLPIEVGQFHKLQKLTAIGNELTGSIPDEMSSLSDLHTLSLNYGQLKGDFISGERYLAFPSLRSLSLSGNRLTGRIPDSIAKLSLLDSLHLDGNLLNGTLPTTLGKMSLMTELVVKNNTITGTLPSELGFVTSLGEARFEHNLLTGSLPDEIFSLTNLVRLELSFNNLSGPLSPAVGGSKRLKILTLDHNVMTGTVPVELTLLHNTLSSLYLEHNRFSGSVPPQVCSLRVRAGRGFLRYFNADCLPPENPPHVCSCCNWCCLRNTENCTKQ